MKSNYEILGLQENAPISLVEKKYGALLRQYKQRTDEKGVTYEDLEYYRTITQAYDEITGKKHDLTDENPGSIIPYSVRRKLERFSAYISQYALLIIAFVIVVTIGTMVYFQIKENRRQDITLKFVGAFSVNSATKFIDEIKEKSKVVKEPTVSFFTVTTETDLNTDKINEAQAFLFQLVGKNLDVILIDKESYDVYVKESAFLPLDDILEKYKDEQWYDKVKHYEYKDNPDTDDDNQISEAIYGIDITESAFFNSTSLKWLYDKKSGQEKTMILTIARTTKNREKAEEFMLELISHIP